MLKLRLTRSDNTVSYIELVDTQVTLQAESGVIYSLFNSTNDKVVSPFLLKKKGNALLVETEDGVVLELNDFYGELSEVSFDVGQAGQTSLVSNNIANSNSIDGVIVWQATGSGILAGDAVDNEDESDDSGWLIFGGLATVGLIASGSGGNESVDNPESSIVTGTVVSGPVISTNDLIVEIYAADGTTKLGESTLDANGQYSVDLGSYTGVIIAKVVNQGVNADYMDEATGLATDMTATLMATAVVPGGTVTLNINPLTTVAAIEAGMNADATVASALSAESVNNANIAVADAFGLTNLIDETVVTTVDTIGNDNTDYDVTDGVSNGELYGAVLAALSGADSNNAGDMQATINAISSGLTVTGNSGSLDSSAQNLISAGALTADADNSQGLIDEVAPLDTTLPTVTITDDTAGTATGDVTYTFTFSEAVTGFTVADVTVTGGTKAGSFASGVDGDSVYTLVVTPDANSTTAMTVDVAANVAQDAAGNNNTAATQSVQAVNTDVTAPTVTITDDTAGTATGDVTYTFTFSEAVTGFTVADVTVTSGTKAGSFASGVDGDSVYTLVVTPDANSTTAMTVDVAANVAQDAAGNNNTAATQSVQAVNTDVTAPTVTITDDTAGTATGDVTYTFTFSEAVTGFTVADVTVTGGTKAGSFASGVDGDSVYTLVVTPDANSTTAMTVDVAANVAQDAAGNNNTAATQSVQAVDTAVPTVTITDDTAGTATGDVTYTFTFSEAVTGFTVADVTVTGGTKAGSFASGVDGDSVYTLVVTPDANSTTAMTVDVAANVAQDAAGNNNTAATQSVQAVDSLAPSITNVSIPDSAMAVGDVVTVTITVADDGGDTYTNLSGTIGGFSVGNLSRTNSTTYTAQFTVTDGGTDVAAGSDIPVSLSIDDSAGNTSAAYTTAISQANDGIDANQPTVTITDDTAGTATGDVIYTFTFSEAVTGFTVADVTVTGGTKAGSFASGVDGDSVYTLVVTPDANSTTAMTVDVAANVAQDAAGNNNTAATQSVQAVDTFAPIITNVSIHPSKMIVGDDVPVTITVEDDGGDTYTNLSGTIGGFSVGSLSRINSTTYTAQFTVTEGGTDVLASSDVPVSLSLDDSVGNTSATYNTAISQPNDLIDANTPTLTITDDTAGTATGPVTYTFTFSEGVTGFIASDVTVTGGTRANNFASGADGESVYTMVITPDANSTNDMTVRVEANAFADEAGNFNTVATQSVQAVNTVPVTLTATINTATGEYDPGTAGVTTLLANTVYDITIVLDTSAAINTTNIPALNFTELDGDDTLRFITSDGSNIPGYVGNTATIFNRYTFSRITLYSTSTSSPGVRLSNQGWMSRTTPGIQSGADLWNGWWSVAPNIYYWHNSTWVSATLI